MIFSSEIKELGVDRSEKFAQTPPEGVGREFSVNIDFDREHFLACRKSLARGGSVRIVSQTVALREIVRFA